MKILTTYLPLIVLTILFASGCSSQDIGAESSPSVKTTIVCEAFYRASAGGSLKAAPKITFTNESDQKTHEFENMAFEAVFRMMNSRGRPSRSW